MSSGAPTSARSLRAPTAAAADWWRDTLLASIVLALGTLLVFAPVRNYAFTAYDDNDYVTGNSHVQQGLNSRSIQWAMTSGHAANWHPLTWFSHMLDCRLFGLDPGPHHMVNVLLHMANVVLVLLVLRKMTDQLWPSAVVAALFAWHPLHVESVAWVAERKDVLSGLFALLTVWLYARYASRPTLGRYWPVALALALGLMAKPMLVTLPFALLLLDIWPLRRLGTAAGDSLFPRVSVRQALVEKAALLPLSLASSIITYCVQEHGQAVQHGEAYALGSRLGNALVSYVRYVGTAFWPTDLAVLYPYRFWPAGYVAGALCLLIAITVVGWMQRRQRPYLLIGWLWFVGMLVPVIGLVQVGIQALADRYTYLPLLGLAWAVVWTVAEWARAPARRVFAATGAVVILAVLLICTGRQVQCWQNASTLFSRAVDVTTDNWLAHGHLATELSKQRRFDEAAWHYREVIRIRPGYADGYFNWGNHLARIGQPRQAAEQYRQALALEPNLVDAQQNLGAVLAVQGDFRAAAEQFAQVVQAHPEAADAHCRLAAALAHLGQHEQAIAHYEEALRLDPASERARRGLDELRRRMP